MMNKRHKHAEVIKAWADGAEIEVFCNHSHKWQPITCPTWSSSIEYRVKPEPKPDIVRYVLAVYNGKFGSSYLLHKDVTFSNIKLTYDGETHKLKSVELINKE